MPFLRRVLPAATCATLLLTSCSSLPGDTETDRQAQTLSEAISYPRQNSAMGFARAALATRLGRSPEFAVLEAREITPKELTSPLAHLVIRIHRPAVPAVHFGQRSQNAFDACYGIDFSYHGLEGSPERIPCPANATPITPPPVPKWAIPQGTDTALKTVLDALPQTPAQAEVQATLTKDLPAPPVDPDTKLAGLPTVVDVRVNGSDVGVSVRAGRGENVDCMLGSRVNGTVKTWSLTRKETIPGEGPGCSPDTALRH